LTAVTQGVKVLTESLSIRHFESHLDIKGVSDLEHVELDHVDELLEQRIDMLGVHHFIQRQMDDQLKCSNRTPQVLKRALHRERKNYVSDR